MGNLSALLLFLACFGVPLLSPTLRRDRKLLMAAYAGLLVRDFIALFNAFVTPILTSWGDLYRFHNIGAGLDAETGQPYGEFLKIVYKLLGTSFWLGEQMSILAFTISLLFFVEIALMIGARERLLGCILIFGCLPSPAIHCSVTLRESYQVMGFLGCAYSLLRIRSGPNLQAGLCLAASVGVLVFMHNGLGPYAAGMLALGVPWALQGRGKFGGVLALVSLTFIPIVLPRFIDTLAEHSSAASILTQGNALAYAASYRNWVNESRSDYGFKIDTDNVVSFIATSLAVVAMYFVAPLPWQASRPIDFYAFGEVLMRLYLLGSFARQVGRDPGEIRKRKLFLFGLAMSLEFLWALGTTNWGTSLRHHVVAFGAFVLLGLPKLSWLTLDSGYQTLLLRRAHRDPGAASEVEATVDMRVFLSAFWLRRRLFWGVFCITALIILMQTKPPPVFKGNSAPTYSSSGSLLLSSGRTMELGIVTASTVQKSDLSVWLSTEELFFIFLDRQKFFERVEKATRPFPSLRPYARALVVRPQYVQVKDVNLYRGESDIELDYAQVDQSGEIVVERQRRAARIEITARASTPQDAQKLAEIGLQVLQKLLVEAATRRIVAQRRTMESYLRVATRKLRRAEHYLLKQPFQEPGQQESLQRSRLSLEAENRRLVRDVESLQFQMRMNRHDVETQILGEKSPTHERIRELERQVVVAKEIYMPENLDFQALNLQLESMRRFAQQGDQDLVHQLNSSLQAQCTAKQALLREYQAELKLLRSYQASDRIQSELREKEKEVTTWQQELLDWERQLLAARLEEKICRGDGTAVPLRTPLPGIRTQTPVQALTLRYKRTLTWLPLAPLFGLVAVIAASLATQSRNVSGRVFQYLDAPVITELPTVPAQQCRG